MKTRKECLAEYGSDYKIQQMVEAGKLFRVGKALYSEEKYVPELAVLARKYPKAVVTMRNAFYMYGLTDMVPDEYDLATERDAAKIKDKRVKQFFSPPGFFEQGITTSEYKGYQIRLYSRERMLIELIRYKSKLPFDYYKEILLNFRKIMPQLNIQVIQDYAYEAPKSAKIMETLQMEVL
ncbi:MAG: hypothetical protein IJ188_06685 [Clostridia bacterium]|nr:hypothetical protein [Clostridia bacterium]